MLRLVDSHAHLNYPELLGDLEAVLARAQEQGVRAVLTIGCLRETGLIRETLDLLDRYAAVYAALGVHPHDAHIYSDAVESGLVEAMAHPKVLAWGEIGLDYFYEHSPRDVQRETFRRQIRAAHRVRKPIIIHMRDSEQDIFEILEQEESHCRDGGIFHCFTSTWDSARRALGLGFSIAFGGILTFPRSADLREVAGRVPQDRILIETDSPYLAPVPHRGSTNEPARVRLVAEKLAEVRGLSLEETAAQTTANFEQLFGLSLP